MQQTAQRDDYKITCPYQNQAELLCANRNCQKPGSLCFDKKCQCRKEHRKCLLSQVQQIITSIIDSKMNLPKQAANSFATVQKIIERMIEDLTKIKQDLYVARENFSLRKNQKKLFAEVTNKRFDNINGKLTAKVLQEFQKGKKPQIPQQKIIQQSWAESQQNFKELCKDLRKYFKNKERKQVNFEKMNEQVEREQLLVEPSQIVSHVSHPTNENIDYISKSKRKKLRQMGKHSKYA